mgnify:CR=1 FL=1
MLKPTLYKNYNVCTLRYSSIVEYLGLKQQKSLSKIKQQLKNGLEELKQKKFIYHFEYLQEHDKTVSITFTNNPTFFKEYFMKLESDVRNAVSKKADEILDNSEHYPDIIDKVDSFMKESKLPDVYDDIESLRQYYLCYFISENGLY